MCEIMLLSHRQFARVRIARIARFGGDLFRGRFILIVARLLRERVVVTGLRGTVLGAMDGSVRIEITAEIVLQLVQRQALPEIIAGTAKFCESSADGARKFGDSLRSEDQ